jgi:phospholipid/cholesterol/gamma-HCH transport system substrate-binding protein
VMRAGRRGRRVMGTPFRERNPVVIGTVGLAVIALLMLAAFNAGRLPIIGGGTTYHAAFAEAAGLKPGDEVRVAGVKVGKVDSVDLEGDQVRADFTVRGAWIGDESTVDIKIKTVLGAKYLSIDPKGTHPQVAGQEIPVGRTTTPFDVFPAFEQLTEVAGRIDTRRLAQALDTLSETFQDSPADVRSSLAGLSRLSRTVASRDAQLTTLLRRTRLVTRTLADRDDQLVTLIEDGNLLLQEIQRRRQVIHALLESTSNLALQLSGLVQDNRRQLTPALTQLGGVVGLLQRNQDNLDRGIAAMAPFVRVFTNTLGNGRWFDSYIQNLLSPFPPGLSPGGGR